MATQRTVLITGCSIGGLGDALAQSFHAQGLRVFATARSLSKIQHLKEMGMETLAVDVSDVASLPQAVAAVKLATGGTLDILVNNAAVAYPIPILDADIEQTRRMYDVNVIGVLAVTQAFAPLILRAKGVVVNIGSISGVIPNPWQGVYSASKAATNQLTKIMRLELEPFDVKVVLVVCGVITSNFFPNRLSSGDSSLPPHSIYRIEQDLLDNHISGRYYDSQNAPRRGVADKIVKNALKSRPSPQQWVGGQSFLAWLASTFTPPFLQHIILYYKFGLHTIQRAFKKGKSGTD